MSSSTTRSKPVGANSPIHDWFRFWLDGWNRFWFTPAKPHTLCAMRILAGWMLLYTHVVWTIGLNDFLGPSAWFDRGTAGDLSQRFFVWSPLYYFDNPTALALYHGFTVLVMLALFVGWRTREVSVLAWLLTVSYCHRLQGALFGLDQANAMVALYLMLGPAGAVYSVDRWLAKRRGDAAEPTATVSANVAIRLLQVHLCVLYFFSAVSKMKGATWWDGSAVWFAVANLEYQSLDLTWMARFPALIAICTHVTVFWELSYCALVWHRSTRPITLGLAVLVHGGIALAMGMITFGTMMIFANFAFVPPDLTERWMGRLTASFQGRSDAPAPA